ncbi:DUF6600 domain-containing protein [Dyella nitratireducens]|uniref:Proline-rich exported protein n=1 Tax=Dyella nitratireducens TaxID=1849580 RepID=A0ABQ1FN74_9GAMM|nr:DUF6600 domain-containing protein [Dyella nitratireducens]GGA23547.1 proline-rich exported protein [Dyella nitratireducens]GLQ43954.1 proline-rich exported protein [Dyella nitratireducens]
MRGPDGVVSLARGWRAFLAVCLLLCTGLALAQTDDSQTDATADPPARVARLSYASGDLGLMPAGSTEWAAADVNRPLTNGDKLSSGPDARAELELGGAALRISNQTDIGVLNLSDQIGQFELTQGTLSITVRNVDQGADYEIDTPTLALVINQPGTFRVDVGANGNGTTVTVFDGGGIVYGENNAQREVFSGRSYQFGDSTLSDMTVSDIQGRDEFDAWSNDRDAQYASSNSTQYVSPDVVGSQDLNQYGDWQQDDDYGAVWYPTTVAAGWAPYSLGHWVWIAPWGWTWVDAMPWGFAPYHYGRWVYLHRRWGWIPCAPRVRPIYAPALVAFVGIGRGGPVGWFPLGPHEVYNPWYRASRNYYTNVNLTNIRITRNINQETVINNIHNQYGFYHEGRPVTGVNYANRDMPHAFTAISAQAFASARNVQASQVRVDPQQFAHASVMAAAPVERPSSASFGQPRVASTRPLPSAAFNRPVVAVRAPAANVVAVGEIHAAARSNVRVLNVQPQSSPRVVSGQTFPRYGAPAQTQAAPRPVEEPARPQAAPRPAAPALPQVPHFAPAQQVQQTPRYEPQPSAVQQAPRYAPQPSMQQEQERQAIEQERFNAAQRAHQYVPEQQAPREVQPNPSYMPQQYHYQPPAQYARPEMGRPAEQQPHPQSAPHPQHAPPPARNDQQH